MKQGALVAQLGARLSLDTRALLGILRRTFSSPAAR